MAPRNVFSTTIFAFSLFGVIVTKGKQILLYFSTISIIKHLKIEFRLIVNIYWIEILVKRTRFPSSVFAVSSYCHCVFQAAPTVLWDRVERLHSCHHQVCQHQSGKRGTLFTIFNSHGKQFGYDLPDCTKIRRRQKAKQRTAISRWRWSCKLVDWQRKRNLLWTCRWRPTKTSLKFPAGSRCFNAKEEHGRLFVGAPQTHVTVLGRPNPLLIFQLI